MSLKKLFSASAPLAFAFSLSACGEQPVNNNTAHCEAVNLALPNNDLKQRFKIVDNQSGNPINFTGAGLQKKGDTYLWAPALGEKAYPENQNVLGWEYNGMSFEIHLDKKTHEIKTCSIVNGSGDGPVYGPANPVGPN